MIVLRQASFAAQPWKNGGGVTREICREPPVGEFDWRLSLATIDRPGSFSPFPGYARTLVLVSGAGVQLQFGDHGQSSLSTIGSRVCFDGAWPVDCTLRDGPSTDLNLIVSMQRAQSTSRCLQLTDTERIVTTDWTETIVCCICGEVQIEAASGGRDVLAAVDVARCFPDDGVLTCRPGGTQWPHVFVAGVRR
ncbi:MAG TPA: HutD family protein [Steroidobacteraceae bacterium]